MPSRAFSAFGWIQGVRIFRVDNPHTKAFPFWQWVIPELKAKDPDVLFLAEAFTRPRVMERLAKLGFSQSYTYFTWRDTKEELTRVHAGTHHHPGTGILPSQLLAQHPRHSARTPADAVACRPFAAGWCWPRP